MLWDWQEWTTTQTLTHASVQEFTQEFFRIHTHIEKKTLAQTQRKENHSSVVFFFLPLTFGALKFFWNLWYLFIYLPRLAQTAIKGNKIGSNIYLFIQIYSFLTNTIFPVSTTPTVTHVGLDHCNSFMLCVNCEVCSEDDDVAGIFLVSSP